MVALGDCAVTATSLPCATASRSRSSWSASTSRESTREAGVPTDGVPTLLKQARPLHEVVKVDMHRAGLPAPAKTISIVLTELLDGRKPDARAVDALKFG